MNALKVLSIIQVTVGAMIMLMSIVMAMKIKTHLSRELYGKWKLILPLMVFFFLGYLFFLYASITKIHFPLELITASIFFGGSCFVYIVVKLTDVSILQLQKEVNDRENLQRLIVDAKEEWEETFDIINDAITIHDSDYGVIRANKAAKDLLGLSFQEIIGSKCYHMYHGTKSPPEGCPSCSVMKNGEPSTEEIFEPNLNKFIEVKALPRFDNNNRIIGVVHVVRDITNRKKMEEKLHNLSITDHLTGLYNRRGFFSIADQQIKIAKRMHKGMLLLSADLDYLKIINDTFGHKEGDIALYQTADILKESFRESDIIARIGGDEFVVLQMEDSHINSKVLTERLDMNLEKYNRNNERGYSLSMSVGIARYNPESPCTIEELLSQADTLMYDQKRRKQRS